MRKTAKEEVTVPRTWLQQAAPQSRKLLLVDRASNLPGRRMVSENSAVSHDRYEALWFVTRLLLGSSNIRYGSAKSAMYKVKRRFYSLKGSQHVHKPTSQASAAPLLHLRMSHMGW